MAGRPPLTEEQKEELLRKLEPYLKGGFSVNKACLEAEIPTSTVYDLIGEDVVFAEKIRRYENFISIMVGNAMAKQLNDIIEKQNKNEKLTKDEVEFLKWYSLNSNKTRDEFGERKTVGTFDTEAEIKRIKDIGETEGSEVEFDEDEKATQTE